MLLKALRRHADIRDHMARVPTDQLFRLMFRMLSWVPDQPARSLEAKEIALRTLANLALNPRLQSKFIDFGKYQLYFRNKSGLPAGSQLALYTALYPNNPWVY